MLNFIINHQRFKKQFKQNELTDYLDDENRINRFPQSWVFNILKR